MPWLVLQIGVELLTGLMLFHQFGQCHNCREIIQTFLEMQQLEQIGTITVVVLMLNAVIRSIREAFRVLSS